MTSGGSAGPSGPVPHDLRWAAAFLIREAGFAGCDIHILEEQDKLGGSLDAAGSAESGYTMRGGRMFEVQFRCTYDLLSSIPSLDDPARSVTADIFGAHEELGWDDVAHLVDEHGKVMDAHSMGFSERDRLELVQVLATPESGLDGKRIDDCFNPGFFTTNFWFMWCTTFAFEPWHNAIEFRRYLNRFVHLFPSFATMTGIYRTRYNQYDSTVREIRYTADGRDATIDVAPEDLVFVTNGSMTANSSLGSHDAAAVLDTSRSAGAWRRWETLAAGRPDFGDPTVFAGHVADSRCHRAGPHRRRLPDRRHRDPLPGRRGPHQRAYRRGCAMTSPHRAAVIETHAAIVFFVGDRAYKLKKPVDLGFLDFRRRVDREAVCHREVELNRRLAPDVYLGVADVQGPDGQPCDHLMAMRRMPADRRSWPEAGDVVTDRNPDDSMSQALTIIDCAN